MPLDIAFERELPDATEVAEVDISSTSDDCKFLNDGTLGIILARDDMVS